MKTTERFENAVTKLYKAFHKKELNGLDCTACAVGNIVNNDNEWWHHRETFGTVRKGSENVAFAGYNMQELLNVEMMFLYGHSGEKWLTNYKRSGTDLRPESSRYEEATFDGMCDVIKYLAKLDNIPNPLDYTKVFERENDKPKYELKEVF